MCHLTVVCDAANITLVITQKHYTPLQDYKTLQQSNG